MLVTAVLGLHALRRRFSLAYLYGFLGLLVAATWATPQSVAVRAWGMEFLLVSGVIYAGILLGVFVCYVVDGPVAGRAAIAIVLGGTIVFPLMSQLIRHHFGLVNPLMPAPFIPFEGRNYFASIGAFMCDLVWLTVLWELLNRFAARVPLSLRVLVALLGIMWVDSLVFITLVFGDLPAYADILKGTLASRSFIALFATPPLTLYLQYEAARHGWQPKARPVLALFMAENLERELQSARKGLLEGAEALRRSEERYQATVEDLPLMICRFLPDGRLTYANKAYGRCFGLAAEDAVGSPFLAILPAPAHRELEDLLARLTADNPTGSLEFAVPVDTDPRPPEPEARHRWTIRARRDQQGRVIAYQAIGEDITKVRLLEKQLGRGEKMRAIGQLAGGIAHDFNNILTAILGNAELARSAMGDHGELDHDFVIESLDQIERGGTRAAALTRQLLMFSRQDISQSKTLDLNRTLQEMERMLLRVISEDITLRVTRFPNPLIIRADAGQLEQVIMNLVVNARDAMPVGGRLDLETSRVDLDRNYVEDNPEAAAGPHAVLAISDSGTGITPENIERVFEPFFTTKEPDKGTGLGLATVYGIVKRFGGHIKVYSEPGRGSIFKILWPEHRTAAEESGIHGLAEPVDTERLVGDELILVCEDEESVRRLTVLQLKEAGYRVLAAAHGEEALDLARSSARPVDLLVTDVIMPNMNGRELSDILTAGAPALKTLFVSGYTADTIAQHGVLVQGAAFLEKPFSRGALLRMVRKTLQNHRNQ